MVASIKHREGETVIEDRTYTERVSSNKTEALFLGLTFGFFILGFWRVQVTGFTFISYLLLIISIVFLFYTLNYRTLVILITTEEIVLRFGIFTWKVRATNIDGCTLDPASLWRIGGAGIHFSFFQGRYRAMFNFLEFPRVLLALKNKKGPVQDFAFTTRHPEQVMGFIQTATSNLQET